MNCFRAVCICFMFWAFRFSNVFFCVCVFWTPAPQRFIDAPVEGKNIGAPQNSEKHNEIHKTTKKSRKNKTAQKSSRINIFQRKLMQSTQKNERNPKIISKIKKYKKTQKI